MMRRRVSRSWLGAALMIMGMHAVLGGLTYFLYDWQALSLLGGAALLIALRQVALERLAGLRAGAVWAAAIAGQVLGLVGTLNVALVQAGFYRQNSFGDILDFVMETFHSALLPWITLLPNRLVPTFSGENLVLHFLVVPLFSPLLVLWSVWWARRAERS